MSDASKPVVLSVIIPAYNEATRLPRTLEAAIAYLKDQSFSSEIIVVDDGSVDGTREVALGFRAQFPALRVVEYGPNRGKGYAVRKGMLEAKGEYRLFMDADLAVPITFLDKFLKAARSGADCVIASRALPASRMETHQPFFREFVARAFGIVQYVILRLPFRDTQCGFKLFKAAVAESLFAEVTFTCAYFDAELLYIACQRGLRIDEIAVAWRHDNQTRLPIGARRTLEIIRKLFSIRRLHRHEGLKRG